MKRRLCAGFLAHERVEPRRHFPFFELRITAPQSLRRKQAQYAVAQKFQPFKVAHRPHPAGKAGMGERARQQTLVCKFMTDAFLKLGSVRLCHLTRSKMRP